MNNTDVFTGTWQLVAHSQSYIEYRIQITKDARIVGHVCQALWKILSVVCMAPSTQHE